jgi:hypothetical protein
MPHDPHQRYAIVPLPAGPAPAEAIVVGGLDDVMSYLPQTVAREKRERDVDNLTLQALKTVADANLRADAVIAHEREVKAREDAARAIVSDGIRRFADSVIKLKHRLDALEAERNQRALDALPDPDACPADNLPPASLPPSADRGREQLAAMEAPKDGDKEQLDTVLGDNDQDPGVVPAMPSAFEAIANKPFEGGRLPEGTMFPVRPDTRRGQAVRAKKLLPFSETRLDPGGPTFAQLRRTKYWDLPDDAYEILESDLLRAVSAAGRRNDSIPADSPPREIHERGSNGEHTIRFLGERSFIHDMKAPVRRVAYFRTDQGPVRTDGLPVRL